MSHTTLGGGGSSGGDTQYAEGVTSLVSTGTMVMWKDDTDVVFAAQPSSPLPVSVNGTMPLPTGAATAANQSTEITALQLLDDVVVAQGTALGSTKVSLVGGSVTTAAPTFTTGQINQLSLTTSGALRVDLGATSANATAVKVDGSAVTQPVSYATTGSGTATGAIRVELPTNGTGVIATVGAVTAITNALPAGTNAIGKLAANSGVDIGDVDITSVIPATGATNLGKAEDATAASGDTGVFSLSVANEAQSALAADGDYIARAADTKGNTLVVGNIAHDGADAGNPVKIGAKAVNAEPAAVSATNDRANLISDLVGKLIVLPYANPENFVSGVATATDTTSTSLIGAPASGLRNYITQITVWNSSAVATYIKIQDGSGGTTLYDIPAPAGGGATLSLPTPLRQPTTATAIYFAEAGAANAVFVSASGYKGI